MFKGPATDAKRGDHRTDRKAEHEWDLYDRVGERVRERRVHAVLDLCLDRLELDIAREHRHQVEGDGHGQNPP